jgi:hypothetical protein
MQKLSLNPTVQHSLFSNTSQQDHVFAAAFAIKQIGLNLTMWLQTQERYGRNRTLKEELLMAGVQEIMDIVLRR